MSKTKIELISSGVRALLKSQELLSACEESGKQVAARAGSGYGMTGRISNRAVVRVEAQTKSAVSDNLKNNTLLKALK